MAANRFRLLLEETDVKEDDFDRMAGEEVEDELSVDEMEDEVGEVEEDTLFDLMADFIKGLDPESIDADSMASFEEIKSQLDEMESDEEAEEVEETYEEYDSDSEEIEEVGEEEMEESVSGKKSRFTFFSQKV